MVKCAGEGIVTQRPGVAINISHPGTFCIVSINANAPSFIVDWSQGPVTDVPHALQKYRVSFYVSFQQERAAYVVFYGYDPVTGNGYVYLPGRSDQYYDLNVGTIFRGVEGNWFRAWSVWENMAKPLITKARRHAPI